MPMSDSLALEPWLRAGTFVAAVAVLASAERLWPHRTHRPLNRMGPNVALMLTNTLVVRLLSATSLVGVALAVNASGWGLFHYVDAPCWIEISIAIVLMDASVYLQHRLFHWSPWLWKVHAVHHSDTSFDWTTGVRFHPGEAVASFAMKALTVGILGASVLAVLLFEMLLSTASLFTHSNVRMPGRTDAALRRFLVTPEMHRVHHSVERDEQNMNFGFLLVWWDRSFGTYRVASRSDSASMDIGLGGLRGTAAQRFVALLRQPLVRRPQ